MDWRQTRVDLRLLSISSRREEEEGEEKEGGDEDNEDEEWINFLFLLSAIEEY